MGSIIAADLCHFTACRAHSNAERRARLRLSALFAH
jgi:hypothetical protein